MNTYNYISPELLKYRIEKKRVESRTILKIITRTKRLCSLDFEKYKKRIDKLILKCSNYTEDFKSRYVVYAAGYHNLNVLKYLVERHSLDPSINENEALKLCYLNRRPDARFFGCKNARILKALTLNYLLSLECVKKMDCKVQVKYLHFEKNQDIGESVEKIGLFDLKDMMNVRVNFVKSQLDQN